MSCFAKLGQVSAAASDHRIEMWEDGKLVVKKVRDSEANPMREGARRTSVKVPMLPPKGGRGDMSSRFQGSWQEVMLAMAPRAIVASSRPMPAHKSQLRLPAQSVN